MHMAADRFFSKCQHLENFTEGQLEVFKWLLRRLKEHGTLTHQEYQVLGDLYMCNQHSYNGISQSLVPYRFYLLLVKDKQLLPPDTEFEIDPDSAFYGIPVEDIVSYSPEVAALMERNRRSD